MRYEAVVIDSVRYDAVVRDTEKSEPVCLCWEASDARAIADALNFVEGQVNG